MLRNKGKRRAVLVSTALVMTLALGCRSEAPPEKTPPTFSAPEASWDAAKVRTADISVLFIGNSHTSMHDVPNLVAEMIRFLHPKKSVQVHLMSVGFLEQTATDPRFRETLTGAPWKHVVLQAQKISASGRFHYSQAEGIEFARLGKSSGAKVWFYAEWGVRGASGDGARTEKIYQEMADASETRVAKVGRAWDSALSERSDLPLHDVDGNHQSATGAFLTACVLVASILGESPASLADFPYPHVGASDRKFLADVAARSTADPSEKPTPPANMTP